MKPLTVIGRVEKVILTELAAFDVPAKIDTGADASSIWASKVELDGDRLNVTFFGPGSEFYSNNVHVFLPGEYRMTRVSSSFGHRELRYKVKLKIKIKNRLINGAFTLSNRSTKLYPILIGRSLIKNKFLVDVAKGDPLIDEEKQRRDQLREELININRGEA